MFVTILVIVIVVSGVLFLVLSPAGRGKRKSWITFFAQGKDAGFTLNELKLLRRLAVKFSMDDPTALFWSQSRLDACIRNLVQTARLAGGVDETTQDFLSKLYDYRKKIEMEKPKIKKGMSDSRNIEEGQSVRVLIPGQGVFPSRVLKNTHQCIFILRPSSPKLPVSFSWTGYKISVYFWRGDDAGYVFDTEVQDEVFAKGNPSLKINHAVKLIRTQRRRSIRLKTHKSAYLYILNSDEPSNNIEVNPGLKCFLEDISDCGCAVLIGGKAAEGLRIKVQFILANVPIGISGTIRSIDYNEEENKSLLHIEADLLPIETRNHILGEVFGMLPEEDEDLPFKILDEEAISEADQIGEADEDSPETSAVADEAL